MSADRKAGSSRLSVHIHKSNCNGCLACVRACPTRAMRIRDGKAVILRELCVDCGECIRICPCDAVVPLVSTYKDVASFKVNVALPSPVIYTQFGEDVMPNDILLALSKLGFDYVFDGAKYCEWVNLALSDWLATQSEVQTAIGLTCPVVLRLVAKLFPDLIPNIAPLEPPREVGSKHVRMLLMRKTGLRAEDIGIFHVTPCAAKMVAINHPLAMKASSLDGALGFHDIYGDILLALKELTEEDHEKYLFRASGAGIAWEMTGGEAEGLHSEVRTLSVSGLGETLEVLDQIEAGRLQDIRYVECRVCQDGCLGGPLTVENRYRARSTVRRLVRMFGPEPRVRTKEFASLIESGFFMTDKEIKPSSYPLDKDPLKAMIKRKKVDELTKLLPGRLCAACGAPDCRTLAEDVVLGKASLTDCPFYNDSDS